MCRSKIHLVWKKKTTLETNTSILNRNMYACIRAMRIPNNDMKLRRSQNVIFLVSGE